MRKSIALLGVVTTVAVSLVFGVGTAGAGPQPGGCGAFGAFMGTAVPSAAQSQHPLGQSVRQLTPFNDALQVYKSLFCGP